MAKKKRAYIYVDEEKYARFKKLLDIMGITMTGFFDETMDEFLSKMEDVILNQDKDAFLKMMSINLEEIQKDLRKEIND
ncbi:MAG TPA: hypothetical protein VK071_00025 [Tissierellales bacterium]|nr:hypothetical protein [Tissierellales bacterium]